MEESCRKAESGSCVSELTKNHVLQENAASLHDSHDKEVRDLQEAATSYNITLDKLSSIKEGKSGGCLDYEERDCGKGVRRQFVFEEDWEPLKKMALSTLSGARPASLNINDVHNNDDEPNLTNIKMPSLNNGGNRNCNLLTNCALEGKDEETQIRAIGNQGYEEKVDDCKENGPVISTCKRRKACNVVTSDTEGDIEDKTPISQLLEMRRKETIPDQAVASHRGVDNIRGTLMCTRRRMVSLRQFEEKGRKIKCSPRKVTRTIQQQGISMSGNVGDDDSEKVGSDDGSDNMNGFIVNDSQNTDGDDVTNGLEDDLDCENEDNDLRDVSNSTGSAHREYQDGSDGEVNFIKVLSTIGRKRDCRSEWKDEADMLAAFGKDTNLCMKGVCAMYRREISKEKAYEKTFYCDDILFHDETFYRDENIDHHGRGFNKYDAPRGSNLACFLTGDDPSGDVKKSVEELQEYDPQGVDVCYKLAARYSRQLFEIYKNKEDPYFPR